MSGACICSPRDPEGWYREDCPTHGCADEYGHDCEHTSMRHGADGCNVPGCLCAFMSWDES